MKNDLEPENDVITYPDHISRYEQNEFGNFQLDELTKLGSFFYFYFDFTKRRYTYISESVNSVLGYNPYENFEESSTVFGESMHHPDFLNTQKAIYSQIEAFVKELSSSQISKYIFRYFFWAQNRNKQYVKLSISVKFFKKKNSEIVDSLVALCFKIGDGEPKESIQTLSVYKSTNNGEKRVFEKDFIVEYENGVLTKKETQIWLMLKDNMSGKEIADELGLSIHTVNTHRKNIYKKLKN